MIIQWKELAKLNKLYRLKKVPVGGLSNGDELISFVCLNGKITLFIISLTTPSSPPISFHDTDIVRGSTKLAAIHNSYSVSF